MKYSILFSCLISAFTISAVGAVPAALDTSIPVCTKSGKVKSSAATIMAEKLVATSNEICIQEDDSGCKPLITHKESGSAIVMCAKKGTQFSCQNASGMANQIITGCTSTAQAEGFTGGSIKQGGVEIKIVIY